MNTSTSPLYIPVHRAYRSRLKEVDWDHLELGLHTSDHMLINDYADGEWQGPEIRPFGPFLLSPTTLALHYGQTVFEGMKAFRMQDGRVQIFRPDRHYERLVRSADRLCMPVVSQDVFLEGLHRLLELEKEWVPGQTGSALYIRPFIIATETKLTAKVSDNYRFAIICTPAGPYYPKPIRVKVERQFVRAARGGTGYAKCGGNYGAALYPTRKANEEGYDQVLWTDALEHACIEESGTMNVFFVIGDRLITPALTDTLLDGVTRDSLVTLAAAAGIEVEERPVSVEELKKGFKNGRISEAFGAGTAAVISPIKTIGIDGQDYQLPIVSGSGDTGQNSLALRLKEALDDIRYGRIADLYNWNFVI